MSTEYYTFSAIIEQIAPSGKAIRIIDCGNDIWLPLSWIQINGQGMNDAEVLLDDVVEITIPEWLAIKKDLI